MRADKFFSQKYGSRTKAAEAIDRGLVLINGKTIKPKTEIAENDIITYNEPDEYFVSNGGYKLERAVKYFNVNFNDLICVDIGASTGGFTDCLLQNGAKKVYAVDVGESLLHPSLKQNKKIVSMENINARYLSSSDFEDKIDCVTADVSFISLRLILPVIKNILSENGIAFILIKPQFECEKKNIGKSGIVNPSSHAKIVEKILSFLEDVKLSVEGIINAPIRKGKNIEYILYVKNSNDVIINHKKIIEQVNLFVKNKDNYE